MCRNRSDVVGVVIQELLNHRDDLEQQLREVTVQLGQVEKQRLEALKDTQTAQVCMLSKGRDGGRGETLVIRHWLEMKGGGRPWSLGIG